MLYPTAASNLPRSVHDALKVTEHDEIVIEAEKLIRENVRPSDDLIVYHRISDLPGYATQYNMFSGKLRNERGHTLLVLFMRSGTVGLITNADFGIAVAGQLVASPSLTLVNISPSAMPGAPQASDWTDQLVPLVLMLRNTLAKPFAEGAELNDSLDTSSLVIVSMRSRGAATTHLWVNPPLEQEHSIEADFPAFSKLVSVMQEASRRYPVRRE